VRQLHIRVINDVICYILNNLKKKSLHMRVRKPLALDDNVIREN